MTSAPEPATIVPVPQPDRSGGVALLALLQFEADLRRQASVDELAYLLANDGRKVMAADQVFVLREAMLGEGMRVLAVSSMALVDRNAPLIQAIEAAVAHFGLETGLDKPGEGLATDWTDDPAIAEYPFAFLRWQPLARRDGTPFGGLLVARALPWGEGDAFRLQRVGETAAHAWLALTGDRPVRKVPLLDRRKRRWLAIGLAVVAFFPVRMTALAPVEVVAERPFVIAAPYAGVIARIEVPPNAMVKAGQPVLTFEDIKLRNELQQATERVAVARAKLEQATSAAFADAEQAREIGPLRAEFDLAQADYAYARELMGKAQIAAPQAGMAIYSDRRDWEGRAVNTGDPIMQIADPNRVAYRIDLPAREQMQLRPGAPVKVWLDAQPLWALDGRIETASYQARPTAEGVLAFAVVARTDGDTPRIGSRGMAKLYGQWVPFAYSLFKRPIASARQFLGF